MTKFRSPAEFLFHAKWLLLGMPTPETVPQEEKHDEELWGKPLPEEVNDRCMCKYCGKTKQKYISENFTIYTPSKTLKRTREGPLPIQARFEGVKAS